MTAEIKFGTSGWRAIVADEFTLANIRRAVAGIAQYVAKQDAPKSALVGRDPRFLGETFVAEAANILAAHGVAPLVIPDPAPTPAIAYAVRQLRTGGSINSPPRIIPLSTTASSTPRPTALRRCPKPHTRSRPTSLPSAAMFPLLPIPAAISNKSTSSPIT